MRPVRLGAVGYLNTRPLVYGLEASPLFALRFDVPARCAELLHSGETDLGLIPSIEYLRNAGAGYRIVPDLAIASRGPVASVALFSKKPVSDVRSIAMDTGSRTSVALIRVLCDKAFGITPVFRSEPPDLDTMLAQADAALIIGDIALFEDRAAGGRAREAGRRTQEAGARRPGPVDPASVDPASIEKIDLGEVWTKLTGLPFVYAFWAGTTGVVSDQHLQALRAARDAGVEHVDDIARASAPESRDRQAIVSRYLRDNIKYGFGPDERKGLDLFYRYAAEAGVVQSSGELRFY
jgi:chorismate dehydratase